MVVNQRIADEFFPGQDPVGHHLQDNLSKQPSVEIIGVVGNVKHEGATNSGSRAVPTMSRSIQDGDGHARSMTRQDDLVHPR